MIQRSSSDELFSARDIIRHVKSQYEAWKRTLKDDEDVEITVPLSDGTKLSLKNIKYIAPNFILVQGLGANNEEVNAFTSPYGIQFIFRIAPKDSQRKAIGFKIAAD